MFRHSNISCVVKTSSPASQLVSKNWDISKRKGYLKCKRRLATPPEERQPSSVMINPQDSAVKIFLDFLSIRSVGYRP
jgi:hypothetical protein